MPTLADVLCGFEPGDRFRARNCYGQEFDWQVVRIEGDCIIAARPEWQALGHGWELLRAREYELVRVYDGACVPAGWDHV